MAFRFPTEMCIEGDVITNTVDVFTNSDGAIVMTVEEKYYESGSVQTAYAYMTPSECAKIIEMLSKALNKSLKEE